MSEFSKLLESVKVGNPIKESTSLNEGRKIDADYNQVLDNVKISITKIYGDKAYVEGDKIYIQLSNSKRKCCEISFNLVDTLGKEFLKDEK